MYGETTMGSTWGQHDATVNSEEQKDNASTIPVFLARHIKIPWCRIRVGTPLVRQLKNRLPGAAPHQGSTTSRGEGGGAPTDYAFYSLAARVACT